MSDPKRKAAFWLTEYNTPHDAYCHGIIEVIAQRRTRFQDMLIVDSGTYGKALILDGHWQSSMGDEFMYHEALVHPALVIHTHPADVLVLGGGEGATVREVLKWRCVDRVVMVDLDGEVVEACRRFLPQMHQGAFDDSRTELVTMDALEFLQKNDQPWDVIIADLTDPLPQGPSFKLFTRETMEMCRRALAADGVFVMQAGVTGPPEMGIHVRIIHTAASVFPHVHHYISQVPTWASPMGFLIGRQIPFDPDPEPAAVDTLLKTQTNGQFKMFDGRSMRSIMHPPKYLRDAIAAESRIYTLADPPQGV
jgi:spermidine synthase